MNSNKGKTAPPRSGITLSPPRESLPMLRHLARLIIAILAITTFAPKASADNQIAMKDVSFGETDLTKTGGLITLEFPFYDDEGKDEGLPYTDDFFSYLSINGKKVLRFQSFKGSEQKQDEASWYWIKTYVLDYSYFSTAFVHATYSEVDHGFDYWSHIDKLNTSYPCTANITKNKGNITTAVYELLLSEKALREAANGGLKVELYIDAQVENGHTYSWLATETYNYTLPSTPDFKHEFSDTPGKYLLEFNAKAGNYYEIISPASLKQDSTYIDGTKVQFLIPSMTDTSYKLGIVYNNLIKTHTRSSWPEAKLYYKDTCYVDIDEYPQPKNFKATLNNVTGKVDLTWNMATAKQNTNYKGEFQIQRSTDSGFNNDLKTYTVSYDYSKSSYTYSNDVSDVRFDGTYYYRIRRSPSASKWEWDEASSYTSSLAVKVNHKYVKSANAKLIDDKNVNITWEYDDGNVWGDNTEVLITRFNQGKGTNYTITIPADSVAKRSYTEELTSACDIYSYDIAVNPNSNAFGKQTPVEVSSNGIPLFRSESGRVLNFETSKGYFSDHVELEWTSDGNPIDVFSIQAREYGSGNEFRQIDQVTANLASTQYSYSHTKAIPGVVYEYQIATVTKCGEQNVTHIFGRREIGFRTPTGDIYGRVTFESGQAVPDVEVRAEFAESSGITGKAYRFEGNGKMTVDNKGLLNNATDEATIEAWVKPESDGVIVKKPGMYTLEYKNDKFAFTVGSQTVTTTDNISKYTESAAFVHIAAVAARDKIYLYVNDTIQAAVARTGVVTADSVAVEIGENFKGAIDEVRLWSVARDSINVARDYSRYLVGNETGLEAYYTFDYSVDDQFFDISYVGTEYHKNHGTVTGAAITETEVPTTSQMGYRSYTDENGSYSLRALPFKGNGTAYLVIPRLGIHQFEAEKELRLISLQSQTHTVNFTDKSSFAVHGTVTYKGGTIPVEGVSFKVDGVTVMDGKGNIVMSGADGHYTISVPVGIHEVKAVLNNHVFEDDGRITDLDGNDCNYQDDVNSADIVDITTVRYIGRVAGGRVQEEYPLGHSLSKNNLADSIKVTLTHTKQGYDLSSAYRSATYEHHKNPYVNSVKTNKVEYDKQTITITPNPETGEFFADVLPIAYNIIVDVPGYDAKFISGNKEPIDFSSSFIKQYSEYEYVDSISEEGEYTNRVDSVEYQHISKFIATVSPSILVKQLENGSPIDYFGKKKIKIMKLDSSKSFEVTTYDEETGKYLIGKPVYEQGQMVTLGITTAQVYRYKDSNGNNKADVAEDIVPVSDATLNFGGDLAYANSEEGLGEVETDENGYAEWTFQVGNPELTSALRSLSITMSYGDSETPTTIDWDGKFSAIVIGSKINGNDFLTEGPDQLMFVLRDPPGSNSYSYLEKGVTVSRTSTYNGDILIDASLNSKLKLGTKTVTWTGVGSGVSNELKVEKESNFGGNVSSMIGGTDTDYKEFTTTTRFATSSDPLYVGSNGDLYVGFSTNISIGTTNNIVVMSKKDYSENVDAYVLIIDTQKTGSDYVVVKSTGISLSEKFKTLFVYPQVFIENTLIPKWEDTRNQLLRQPGECSDWQAKANADNRPYFVSKLLPDDDNFGRSNNDPVFGNKTLENAYDGPSYKIYFPNDTTKVGTDSILVFNQSIERWKQHIANNEQQKVNAELVNNISFQAGGTYEYSEAFTTTRTETQRFSFTVGEHLIKNTGVSFNNNGYELIMEESVSTTHGGEFTDEETATHCQGFELAESGDDDYLSVDVCRESGYNKDGEYVKYKDMNEESTQFSTFIFKTKGGATSCPYEGEEKTRYFEPKKHTLNEATVQIEVPELQVENDFIENVPSGKSAYFTLYLRNNSEAQEDGWFNLCLDAATNENGAQLYIDGTPVNSTGIPFLVAAGGTLTKTLEVRKGNAMNNDSIRLTLQSQCQCDPTDFLDDIVDEVLIHVHFTPSATDVNLKRPSANWTYNTKLPTEEVNGLEKHYMEINIDGFDVNYDSFHRIMLQYKPASGSDEDWITLKSFYNDSTLYKAALNKNMNADMIDPKKSGTITYKMFMDDLPDQRYDIRAVGTSLINETEYFNYSTIHSGVKDMYNPRLFGSAQPANGVLTVNDEIRLNFNETIAEGLLTDNNFEVTGVRNGAQTDHSVSVTFDGENDELTTEFVRNWHGKPLTVEMWILADRPQDAVLFSQGTANSAIELGITADNRLRVKVGNKESVSGQAVDYEQGTWAHVALVYDEEARVSAFYNYVEYISAVETDGYAGEGSYRFGASINGTKHYAGKMHNARIWDKACSRARLQTNSLTILSDAESNLLAYYPMNEARGNMIADKAHGANLEMKGGSWAVPEGRAATFNGSNYIIVNASASQVDQTMDYTIELWFKAKAGAKNATILSNGRGDGSEYDNSLNSIELGFDDEGLLYYCNNGTTATCSGTFNDNNWHHVAVAANRTSGRAQIYIDGALNTYFNANDLGGIQGNDILLGARIWNNNDLETQNRVDNFFEGEIDEFRMWELYRSESIEKEWHSQKLDGSEMGLLAYYPFESDTVKQGINYVVFNLKDVKKQRDPALVIPAAQVIGGGNVETSMAAPVRGKDPVSKLLYDFVVNNDALIITLKEPYDRIEKTIVNFTVTGVRDLNGNEIVSPITWSAYIDRNQLKWSESSVSVVKKINEEKSFTVRANNNGGSIQYYTVENMPSWLDVTPSSGTINPVSGTDIKFDIDPSLNIGTYDEVVYLRNDNNVVEALPITVKVEGEKPSWSVNPADYEYNMSIFGKILINNLYSADEEDILAAFNGSECVGICNNKYYKINDTYYAMLTVYSNQAEESKDLEFRIWDASTGSTYIAEPESPIHFVNNSVIGSPSIPTVFTARDLRVQHFDLASGWNWISLNVNNTNMSDINALLANYTWASDDQLKSETDGFVSYSQSGWVGTLNGLNNQSMYMMRSSKAQALDITGASVDTKTCKLHILGTMADGTPRWNYISYLPADNMTLKEALAGYEASEGDIVKSQTSMAMYDANVGWIGSLGYMESSKGYMLQRQAKTDVDLQYPSKSAIGRNTLSLSRTRAANEAARTQVAEYGHRYATNMTAVIRIEGIEALEGDRLAAYVGGECRGEAQATVMPDGTTLFLMTINGENAENVDIALMRGFDTQAMAKAAVTYGTNATVGTIKSPMVINFIGEQENVMVYPTPFYNRLTIRAVTDPAAKVDVMVTDIAGSRVAQWLDCNDNGLTQISWDVDDSVIAEGVYIVNIIIDGKVQAIKTVKALSK